MGSRLNILHFAMHQTPQLKCTIYGRDPIATRGSRSPTVHPIPRKQREAQDSCFKSEASDKLPTSRNGSAVIRSVIA